LPDERVHFELFDAGHLIPVPDMETYRACNRLENPDMSPCRGGEVKELRVEMGVLDGMGAVVTGGSRGIGRAIVQRLAADGATVVFNFARSADHAAQVVQTVRDAGGRAHGVQLDLATRGAVDKLMAFAEQHLDGLNGRIINISTLNTVRPAPGIAPYVASKGAIEQLTKVAAIELGAGV
jgi:3-oxoacyl-[acyl-carrier protein] reductase